MRLAVHFAETDQRLVVGFGETHEVSDGGYDKGYAEGYGTGYTEGETKGEAQGYERGYAEGHEKGASVLHYVTSAKGVFNGAIFPENSDLVFDFQSVTTEDMSSFFSSTKGVKSLVLKTPLLEGKTVALTTAFTYSPVEIIDFTEAPFFFGFTASTFMHCTALRWIKGELNFTNATFNGYEFYNCTSLERVTPKAGSIYKSISFGSSPNLDEVTRQALVVGLADLTGGGTQTLTLHSKIIEKLTDDQKTAVILKNWGIA